MGNYLARRARARRPNGLDGWLEDAMSFIGQKAGITPPLTQEAQCRASADATTAQLDAKTLDLGKTWNPTGFYTIAQVESLVKMTHQMLANAAQVIEKEILEFGARANKDALKLLLSDIHRKMSEGQAFNRARDEAMNRGIDVIDAPGLKRWVVWSMSTASSGISGAAYVACMRPWFVSALGSFMTYFNTVWAIAKTITGVAVAIGEEVLKIPDTVSSLWTAVKWAALIGGAWWAYEYGPAHVRKLGF